MALCACDSGPPRIGELTQPAVVIPKGLGDPIEPHVEGQFSAERDPFGPSFGDELTVLHDCNGDGRLDAFRPSNGHLYIQAADGKFSDDGERLNANTMRGTRLPGGISPHSGALFLDVDGDGINDLLFARDGGLEVLPGKGLCKFGPARALPPACKSGPPTQLAPTDVNADGLVDIAVSCSSAKDGLARLMIARGDGNFAVEDVPSQAFAGQKTGFPSFGTFLDDLDGDGVLDGFFLSEFNMGWFGWGVPGDAPAWQRDDGIGHLVADVNSMSVATLDFDRDGRIDYFLSDTQAANRLLWNRGGRKYDDVANYAQLRGADAINWGACAADFDLDGWTDLLVLRLAQVGDDGQNPARPVLYFSRRNGSFAELGESLLPPGLLTVAEVMTCGDLQRNGRIGCFVANHWRTDGVAQGTLLLRNQVKPLGSWIGIDLQGTVSAANGALARVALLGTDKPQVAVFGGQGPAGAQHDPALLMAVGAASEVGIQVQWPSGIEQHVSGLATGTYHQIIEPRALSVSQRVAHADGKTAIEVVVDPAALGSAGGAIERSGAGTWQGPLAAGRDGKLHRTLIAPTAAGEARILAKVGALTLRVRPRVLFE